MNVQELLTAMLPEHLLLAGIVVLLVSDIASPRVRGAMVLSLIALVAAATVAAALGLAGYAGVPFPGQYSVTASDLLAKALVLALAVPVVLLSRDDFSDAPFHVLLLSSLYGTCVLLSADSFLTLFLGLELMSLPVYVLVVLALRRPQSAEAALKYLVLGGTASAMLLMGASLLFGASGSLATGVFAAALERGSVMAQSGVVLVVAAFFLKAAVVPFHTWAPDAYEGATAPVTAYMAAIVKAGIVLAVVRLAGGASLQGRLADLVAVLALASILWGNLAAMRQTSFRRMIAYSSIAHAGYLFFVLLGNGAGRFQAAAFYALVYGLMNVLAFAALPRGGDDTAEDRLDSLRGLFARAPYAAVMMAIAMLSLAGIPPLPGFIAKFLIFRNVMAGGYFTYAVLGLVGSYVGIYFYLRVVQYMFMSPAAARAGVARRLALGASLLCLLPAIVLSVFPGWILDRL
jgi:NADH-quinone oxidoreductase subunit N